MKLIARGLALIGMLATVQCGSSTSPTNPNSTMNVVLGASSVPAGATTQGTVSLNAPALEKAIENSKKFADKAKHLALFDVEVDAVHRFRDARLRVEIGPQAADREQLCHRSR